MPDPNKLTFWGVRAELKLINMRIQKLHEFGEYRVSFASNDEASAYYTLDLEDALLTARAMRDRYNELTSNQEI